MGPPPFSIAPMATFTPSPPPSPLPRSNMTLSRSDLATLPPEIIACILALIQRHDIFSCVLVSTAWFEIFGPTIWREVVLYRKHSGDLLYDPSRRYFFQAGLVRNGHWVQTFWSDFYSVLDLIVVDAPAPLPLRTSVILNAALDSSPEKSFQYPIGQDQSRVLCCNLSTIYLGDTGLPFEHGSSLPSPSSISSQTLHPQASGQLTPVNLTTGSPSPDILEALTTMALASPPPTAVSFSLATHTPPPTPPSHYTSAYQPKSGRALINLLVQVLKANPYLKNLDVRAPLISGHGDDWTRHRSAVPGVLRSILKECPSTVQELALWFPVPENLESDSEGEGDMSKLNQYTDVHSISAEDNESGHQPLHELLGTMALKSIEIVHPVSDFFAILSFLARCPHLESIYLRDLGKDFDCKAFSSALRRSCRQLCRLEIDCFSGESDQDIAHLINSSFSGWKYLRLDNPEGFGPLATRAVLRHAHSLEQLLVPDCGGFHSRDLQRFLTYAPNLWNFEGTTSNEYNRMPIDVRLSARDLVDSKWACQRLQRLVLVIDNIPRPLIRCRYDGRPFTDEFLPAHLRPGHPYMTVAESHALQREVYRQLGSLHSLQELVLGHVLDREPKFILDTEDYQDFDGLTHCYVARGYQYECLEMTLESGLDLLEGLTSLRVLNVTRMAHRIGVKELEWMSVHWPNLKTIVGLVRKPRLRGLVVDGDDEVLEDEEFDDDEELEDEVMEDTDDDLEIERVLKWVEEHPYGIGSSFDGLNRKS